MYELSEQQRLEDIQNEQEKHEKEIDSTQKDFQSKLTSLDRWVKGVQGMVQACGDLRERKFAELIEGMNSKNKDDNSSSHFDK